MKMYNPPHPGIVLREFMGKATITGAARHLGVNRGTLNRILAGDSGISADMAYRLASAFGTSPELWAGMQLQYDLWKAKCVKRPRIRPFVFPATSARAQSAA